MKTYKVLIFTRLRYSTYTLDVDASSAEKALQRARHIQIQEWLEACAGLSKKEAQNEWNEGEYSALAAWDANAEMAEGDLP